MRGTLLTSGWCHGGTIHLLLTLLCKKSADALLNKCGDPQRLIQAPHCFCYHCIKLLKSSNFLFASMQMIPCCLITSSPAWLSIRNSWMMTNLLCVQWALAALSAAVPHVVCIQELWCLSSAPPIAEKKSQCCRICLCALSFSFKVTAGGSEGRKPELNYSLLITINFHVSWGLFGSELFKCNYQMVIMNLWVVSTSFKEL